MKTKVGIVIPSYNQGEYLEKTIQSVLANKKHIDIDIALIDGGSTDQTLAIIKKYEDEITVWCSEKDQGQADAINKGIRALPECDYYLWLNSDDVYEDEYAVKKIVDFAMEYGYEVCYGLSHFIDKNGNIIGEYPVEPFSYRKLGNRCYLSQPSVMFSRKAYEETGEINTGLHMCLDYEYWVRLAQRYEFGFVREYIGMTRMYGATKTAIMQQRHLQEAMQILMKYYGNIPMHWVTAKFLADHPNKVLKTMPKRILMVVLYPMKSIIIKKTWKEL